MNTSAEGPPVTQPEDFAFTAENLERARAHIAKYPPGRQASAVLPLLDLAQRQSGGWLPQAAMHCVAEMLGMPRIRVYESGPGLRHVVVRLPGGRDVDPSIVLGM